MTAAAIAWRMGGSSARRAAPEKGSLTAQDDIARQQSGWVGVSHGCSDAGANVDDSIAEPACAVACICPCIGPPACCAHLISAPTNVRWSIRKPTRMRHKRRAIMTNNLAVCGAADCSLRSDSQRKPSASNQGEERYPDERDQYPDQSALHRESTSRSNRLHGESIPGGRGESCVDRRHRSLVRHLPAFAWGMKHERGEREKREHHERHAEETKANGSGAHHGARVSLVLAPSGAIT